MIMNKKSIISMLVVMLCATTNSLMAQEYGVGSQIPPNCQSFLTDSGMSAGNYQPGEDLMSTICNDGSGENLVNLYFIYTELPAGDEITIYDGIDMSANSFGTFTGTELQGVDITSTNPNGCLTVHFTSNEDDLVGSFLAEISCATPCARPVAVVTSDETEENPIKVCVGEEINFSGASSTFAEGMSLATFTWDFDDGSTNTTDWPNVTHSFSQPGAYKVQLSLTDNNLCTNGNLTDKLIFVSTTPIIDITSDDYNVCVGQEFILTGEVTPVTWTALPTAGFGGALFIPDNQTTCFSDTLLFGGFSVGSTITAETDIVNFFINFEHSYMGDITITFICPDGSSMNVHQQGGAGTLLGEPIDLDENLNPGVGYDYYWSPDATNGTWEENSGGTLPSGTYESVQPFSNMIGCPLNGEWIVRICDAFASDNGFIFDWSISFADYLYPDLISFTPTFGESIDSTFLSGQFFADIDEGGDIAMAVPQSPGTFIYTYTAIDDFGCSYSEDISISAYPGPVPATSGNINFCGPEMQINGSVTNPASGITYVYSWSPEQYLTSSNTPNTIIEAGAIDETTEFIFMVYPADDPDCRIKDTIVAFVPEVPLTAPLDTADFCAGNTYDFYAPNPQNGYSYVWYYSPNNTQFTEVQSSDSYIFGAQQAGYYYVEVHEPICDFSSTTPYLATIRPCQIKIPNVFTPDGNGSNDTFIIKGIEDFTGSTVKIYNRWGKLVYENKDYKGTWNAADNSAGVYYYVVGINYPGGMEYYEGYVHVLKEE